MRDIFSTKLNAFGLDISEGSLKIVQLAQAGRGFRLSSFGQASIPRGVIEGSKVSQVKQLGQIIKKALKEVKGERIKTKYVVASLPEEKSFLDVIEVPLLEGEELDSAVRFEAGSHIPMSTDEVYFDFELVPSHKREKRQEVLIAATPKEIADSYSAAIRASGLRPKVMEIECLSIVRAIVDKKTQESSFLIIDFGETRTSFIIFLSNTLRFTSTIPISSRSLTKAISDKLGISLAGAEKIKRKEGLTGDKKIFNAMLPAFSGLAEQIASHLKYYRSHQGGRAGGGSQSLEKILLCGGGANLKGLPDFLAKELSLTVQLADPWLNILSRPIKEVPLLSFKQSLGYTTALGLALRAITEQD